MLKKGKVVARGLQPTRPWDAKVSVVRETPWAEAHGLQPSPSFNEFLQREGILVAVFIFFCCLASCSIGVHVHLSTWSIVAVDPKTGDVGVAGASCVPQTHVDAIAALVPGKGAAAIQAFWDLE